MPHLWKSKRVFDVLSGAALYAERRLKEEFE